jgi:alpha-D-ribose 1-methylphosphonate 5-triphosphate diphosphatase
MATQIFTNAHVITPNQNFLGSVVVENDLIVEVIKNKKFSEGIDLDGQFLIPGIIDIHSDYLEKEIHPRPSAEFPVPFAMHYLDARAVSCGITSLFSAISFAENKDKSRNFNQAIQLAKAIDEASSDLLIKHYIHARLDPNTDAVLDSLDAMLELKNLKIVVFNENIPGARQFPLSRAIEMRAKHLGVSLEEAEKIVLEIVQENSAINHRGAIQKVFADTIALGSHDDTTIFHVEEAKHFGASLSEMPTTIEAARKAKELGMFVCMGAPNYYRGGSHCGNLSCVDAINENLVDIFCSDYHFPTLIGSLVKMLNEGVNPSYAVNLMTKNPADYLQMPNLGSIEEGKTADLVSFGIKNNYGAISNVMVNGNLVQRSRYSEKEIAEPVGIIY